MPFKLLRENPNFIVWFAASVILATVPATVFGGNGNGDAQTSESIDDQIDKLQKQIESNQTDDSPTSNEQKPSESPDPGGNIASETPSLETDKAHSNSESTIDIWRQWQLYRNPTLCGLIAGIVLGLLGIYVVSRRIVFVSAALSQVSALGVTVGFLATSLADLEAGFVHSAIPPFFALLFALVAVFFLVWLGRSPSLPQDSGLGIAFVVPMALVVVLGPMIPQQMHEIQAILHGSAVLVRPEDLYAIAVVGSVVLGIQLLGFQTFLFASLDPKVARVQNIPVDTLDAVLFGSIAVMTGLVTRAMGAMPAFGLTVLPAIGALGLKIGLNRVFLVASATGGIAGGGGYLAALFFDLSVGASQVLTAALLALALRAVGRS